jgi:hypothetical protein
MKDFYRACVKIYSPEPVGPAEDAELYVPIFHEWIREGALDLVSIDVADYAHVPDGPGIMLVAQEAAFALDRSDERFGLLGQRRIPLEGDGVEAVATTLRHTLEVAARLEREPRLAGRIRFDLASIRIEANDRLRVPNTDSGYSAFEPVVRAAVQRVFPGGAVSVSRIENDPRDRLAVEVRTGVASELQEYMAA